MSSFDLAYWTHCLHAFFSCRWTCIKKSGWCIIISSVILANKVILNTMEITYNVLLLVCFSVLIWESYGKYLNAIINFYFLIKKTNEIWTNCAYICLDYRNIGFSIKVSPCKKYINISTSATIVHKNMYSATVNSGQNFTSLY